MLSYSASGLCCIVWYTKYFNEKEIFLVFVSMVTMISFLTSRMATGTSVYMVREN
jgi:hypothetical protein